MKSTKLLFSGVLILVALLFISMVPSFYLGGYPTPYGMNRGAYSGNNYNYINRWGYGSNGYGMMGSYRGMTGGYGGMMNGYGGMMGGNYWYRPNGFTR